MFEKYKEGGEMRSFHKRYEYIIEKLEEFISLKNLVVVDCASGCGDGSIHFVRKGCATVGIDIDKNLIKEGKKAFPEVKFMKGSITKMELTDNFADIFVCSETMEHLTRKQSLKAVSEIMRVTKTGSYICVTVPDKKKTCMADPKHRQYLSKDTLLQHFSECQMKSDSVFYKNKKKLKRGNRVLIFVRK